MKDYLDQTEEKIRSFARLQVGWHYGEGIPPSHDVIEKAVKLNTAAVNVGFKKTNSFPGIDGEIQVTAYLESFYLEMTVECSGYITFIYEFADKELENRKITLDEAVARIHNFRGKIWASSDLFITDTTIVTETAFQVSPSNHPAMEAVYPLSMENVPYELAQISANTYKDFIQMSPEYPLSSGKSFQSYYLKNATASNNKVILGMIATSTSQAYR